MNAGIAIAVPRGHFAKSAEGVREIVGFQKDGPVELLRKAWPMLVTFDDITKPETVREVDPEDLATVSGAGVRLKEVTLEITEEAVTVGRVEGVLGWLGDVWPDQLDGQRYETLGAEYPLANSLSVGWFSTEVGGL